MGYIPFGLYSPWVVFLRPGLIAVHQCTFLRYKLLKKSAKAITLNWHCTDDCSEKCQKLNKIEEKFLILSILGGGEIEVKIDFHCNCDCSSSMKEWAYFIKI